VYGLHGQKRVDSNMKHLVITRMHFEDEKLFNHYFSVMKKTYIPSIKSQSNKNFQVALIINPIHVEIVKPFLDDKFIFFHSFDEIKKYCKDNQIIIQTRHDCDDWMREDYIKKIQELYFENETKYDKFIIHSRVQKLNYDTNELHEHATSYDNNNFISMFLTLCQKNVEDFVYDKNHRFMHEITKNIFLIEGGYTRLVVHGKNKLSKINPTDKKVSDKKIENKKTELSVVVPTFDNVEFLNSFLDSIHKAKKEYEIELLIGIDNCLKTKDFVKNNFNRFKEYVNFFFFEKSVGPYVIRNSLAKFSNTNKILFVDSDDLVDQNLFTKVLDSLKTKDIVRFKFYNFTSENEIKNFDEKNIHHFHSIGQFGINKSKFIEFKGYEDWLCSADSEFKMREEKKNLKTQLLNDVLYYRRRHDKSLTKKPETNPLSVTRQTYYNIIKNRRRINHYQKNSDMVVLGFSKFITKDQLVIISDLSNFTEKTQQENKIEKPIKTKKVELTNKQIDYDKINQIFNSNKSIKLSQVPINPNQEGKIKKNTDLVISMMKKNSNKLR